MLNYKYGISNQIGKITRILLIPGDPNWVSSKRSIKHLIANGQDFMGKSFFISHLHIYLTK